MEVEWKVDSAVHDEGWKRINAITGELSAVVKDVHTILDLGGGSGWFGMHLAKEHPDARVISLDIVPRPGEKRVNHIKGSALDIPLNNESVDIIGANAILHHVPDELDKCASEINRVLKPGGYLLTQEPLAENPPARFTRGFVKTNIHEEGERPLSYEKMEQAILKSGLKIERKEFFFLTSYLIPHIIPLAPKALRGILRWKGLFLVRLDRALLEKLPGLSRWAAYVSIVARKQ
ncbi:MAG: methyltransferase domain-containing protein [Candidatus Thermoplasmatota archaeon]|nr:class I SAM-dependent methyltransferase [Euryarchaeota archaeon]MBU4031436.1 methyltransferase domain-containing protein [Candidatus Thermoplasmatota archaeon]MBU4071654.1 methyltransferase domain-containing protein [Candidatus Thermoplasmatota archaeon]MBU4144983.1 methyltransferase domain-containing protein [Candidatus Thermoplasmatota archaeon]MBU4591111.1 methyltransferase domain-containing protein [Candidatus Thermoplasmatota archaeon]